MSEISEISKAAFDNNCVFKCLDAVSMTEDGRGWCLAILQRGIFAEKGLEEALPETKEEKYICFEHCIGRTSMFGSKASYSGS